jgi:DNA-binding NarL/FixJ family response regulator
MCSEVWNASSDNEPAGFNKKTGKRKDRQGPGKPGQTIKLVLVVSSDEVVRERFARLLSRISTPYMLEREKAKALVRILELDVRILVVDVDNNDESLDFIRLVKKMRPRLPILAVTSDSSRTEQDRLLDRGAMVVLVKPVEEKAVVNTVKTLIEA